MKLKINNVRISLRQEQTLEQAVCRKCGIPREALGSVRIVRKAVDARKKNDICLNYHVLAEVETGGRQAKRLLADRDITQYQEQQQPTLELGTLPLSAPPVVIGAGPAGLLAALQLAEHGYKPLLLERGKPVAQRVQDVQRFWQTGEFNPASNVQFGEGGAGTFSDGKLTTRVNDPMMAEILQLFVDAGAPENILYEHKPHVGTDKLRAMVQGLSRRIAELGGSVRYDAHVVDLDIKNNAVQGVILDGGERLAAGAVVLACGHSARDTYAMLARRGVGIVAKPFAIGVRIEHPQALIDSIQYHCETRGEYLPAASYSLVSQENGRGVYSFCMCPGGFIVPAMTDAAESVVNGMSPSGRTSPYANSGLVTEVRLADFEHLRAEWGELAGLKFQQRFEESARQRGGEHQIAPAQRVADFVAGRASGSLPRTSYIPGITPSRLDEWMPGFIAQGLRQGIATFGRRMRGYLTNEAVVVGVESRTSTPVRVPRDPGTLMHPETKGLFPAGEGAGYAGGIISAALDGERIAEAVKNYIR